MQVRRADTFQDLYRRMFQAVQAGERALADQLRERMERLRLATHNVPSEVWGGFFYGKICRWVFDSNQKEECE